MVRQSKATPETFAHRLARLMASRNMTVRNAAEVAGVARSTLNDWRSGVQPTDFAAVRRLARVLGTTLSFLLTGEDDARPAGPASIDEVLRDGGMVFDGICQVTIRRLVPRADVEGDDDD